MKFILNRYLVYGIILLVIGVNFLSYLSGQPSLSGAEVVSMPDSDNVCIHVQPYEAGMRLSYHINDFSYDSITIAGQEYVRIRLGSEPQMLYRGMPDLPSISRSIVIPDTGKMDLHVVSSSFEVYTGVRVAPSKGVIDRSVLPDDISYEFNEVYAQNTWYPNRIAELERPYLLRDFRGQVIRIYPFQYNPSLQILRVYRDVTVEVYQVGPDTVNAQHAVSRDTVDPDFKSIYEGHFLTLGSGEYTPAGSRGGMLVITYDAFWDVMIPFVQWKNMKGIQTEMVNVSDIGDAQAIKAYIQEYYDAHAISYVLLVGDAAQVPTLIANGKASDPSYSYVAGDDHYPDLFVGRFSAQSVEQVETQVQRTLTYERNPPLEGGWYRKGVGIASNQGDRGDDGEYDWEHMRNIRSKLLDYSYTQVDELYDGSKGGEDAPGDPTQSMVSTAVNEGRNIINYCGHGTYQRWSTTGFNIGNVNALTNVDMLPFIWSVACSNGNFDVYDTCFAEAWLRATNEDAPTGAIAVFMSSRIQAWSPPMDAQDEMVDILVESYEDNRQTSFGGISFTGCMHMNDEYGSDGFKETDAWHVFGDPSVQVRTDTPTELTVDYNPRILVGEPTYVLEVPGVEGALCGLSTNYEFIGSGLTNETGHASIAIERPLGGNDYVDLVVTAYNKLPYITTLEVGGGGPPAAPAQPSGPIEGEVNKLYEFSVDGVRDPEGEDVYYQFDWDDGTNTGWLGPYPSGTGTIEAEHQWKDPGYYEVTVKAKDRIPGDVSNVSESQVISIGYRFEIGQITGGLKIAADIENMLATSKYVDWTIEIAGGQLTGFHVWKIINGTTHIKAGETKTVSIPPFFALGKVKITITASCAGEQVATKTVNAASFFLLTFIQ